MADEAKNVDAILCPQAMPKGHDETSRLLWIKNEFTPVLGSKRAHARKVEGMFLITKDGLGDRYYAKNHPSAGEERYVWTDRGDGVMYGTLAETPGA